MTTSEEFKTKIERLHKFTRDTMWDINNFHRLQNPGSFDPKNKTILVDESLDVIEESIVQTHELIHGYLSQKHFGEVIGRMESFSTTVTKGLNLIRQSIITEAYITKYGEKIDSERAVLNVIKMMRTDEFNELINLNLSKDEVFVDGIQFIQDIENRNLLLLREWNECQEAGAYWIGMKIMEEKAKSLLKSDMPKDVKEMASYEITSRINGLRSFLRQLNDHNGEGFRKAELIAQRWGEGWVYAVLHVCLRPDITKFSILKDPITTIKSRLSTTLLSPDKRFSAIAALAESGKSIPPPAEFEGLGFNNIDKGFLDGLFKYLDPDNPKPSITVQDFNEFWDTLDADKDYITLMNRIIKRIGGKHEFTPVQLSNEEITPEAPSFLIQNKLGEITQFINAENEDDKELLKYFKSSSEEKNSLIRTAKSIGILK